MNSKKALSLLLLNYFTSGGGDAREVRGLGGANMKEIDIGLFQYENMETDFSGEVQEGFEDLDGEFTEMDLGSFSSSQSETIMADSTPQDTQYEKHFNILNLNG